VPNRVVRVATRGSEQAIAQSSYIAEQIRSVSSALGNPFDVELVQVTTTGDTNRHIQLKDIKERGIFVKEVQVMVASGEADVAAHSAKDLPSSFGFDGLYLAAVPARRDPRDALVGKTLAGIPLGGTVATGSVRRQAQLAQLRPDLQFVGLRGNIPTRVAKADEVDAVVVAVAGVSWIGLEDKIAEILDPELFTPQVGQGALAAECRIDDIELREVLSGVEDLRSRVAVEAERGFLGCLGGGCDVPVGAFASWQSPNVLILRGLIASLDGTNVLRQVADNQVDAIDWVTPTLQERRDLIASAQTWGSTLAQSMLAAGGTSILQLSQV
jgi:hydroxymethylbilane synthase